MKGFWAIFQRHFVVFFGILSAVSMFSPPAFGASCCAGTSSSGAFSVPKWDKASAGLEVRYRMERDMRRSDGTRMMLSTWAVEESTLLVGGGYRLASNLQGGFALPFIGRRVRGGDEESSGSGMGDLTLGLRYEMIDEETCYLRPFQNFSKEMLKPTLHWIVSATLPSGAWEATSGDALGATITGRGYYTLEAGMELTKILGQAGAEFQARAGMDLPLPENHQAASAFRRSIGGGLLYFFRYRGFVSLSLMHTRSDRRTDASGRQSSTDLTLGLSTRIRRVRFRLNATALGLLQGEATPVGTAVGMNSTLLF